MSSMSTDGSFAVPVSGPSERLAWLRALWLKAQSVARTAWAHAQVILSGAIRLPRWVAQAALSPLSSKAGYDTVVSAIGTGVRAVGRGVSWALTKAGQGLSWLGNTAARLVGRVWPAAETWLRSTAARVAAPAHEAFRWLGDVLAGTGVVAEGLARTPLVRSASTTGAKVAAAVLAVHAMSKGAVAAKIVAAVPASMDAVILLTNPWIALAGVGVVTLSAMGIALARLLAATNDRGPDDGGSNAVTHIVAADVEDVDDVLTDLAEIAKSVHLVVQTDGSVVVEGIPATVPEDLPELVARIAADAAVKHMQRTLRVRPTPSRDDRRLFTKAAREALIAEARRRRHEQEQHAA
jgi:hypothetical protein